jgi:hypothetical protein
VVTERKILHDVTYMWTIKTEKQADRQKERSPKSSYTQKQRHRREGGGKV